MFKRLMIGLVAVGLVVLFIAEAANALSIRRRNTVENFHKCLQLLPDGTRDPCYGATAVTDTLYGVLGADAFCRITGMVVCQLPEGGICTDTSNETILTLDSFVAGASFVTETRSAVDLTVLPLAEGQDVCDDAFAEGTTIFERFWPTVGKAKK